MNNMFDGALLFDQPINGWKVKNSVLDMGWMFAYSDFINDKAFTSNGDEIFTSFNQHQVPPFQLASRRMGCVFSNQYAFHVCTGAEFFYHQLNAWTVSQVTDMAVGMFSRAPNFDHPLDQWKVDNVMICVGREGLTVPSQPIVRSKHTCLVSLCVGVDVARSTLPKILGYAIYHAMVII